MFRRSRFERLLSRPRSGGQRLRRGLRRRQQENSHDQLGFETLEVRCLLAIDVLSSPLAASQSTEVAFSAVAPAEPQGGEILAGEPFPLEDTFFLNSNPSSLRNIYLDFDGHITTGTLWNTDYSIASIDSSPYDSDGVPYDAEGNPSFSDSELMEIQRIWERVVEDFRPFDVNVTTEDPGIDSLRLGGASPEYGVRVVMTDDNFVGPGVGGIAYLNSFDWTSDTPAFSFNDGEKNAAETASHEVGHTVGLRHDGRFPPDEEYYAGHGVGSTSWGAIMGGAFTPNVTQWSQGEYPFADNPQDDLAQITEYLSYMPDDHGSTMATASDLNREDYFVFSGEGVIEQNTDVDYFKFSTDGGSIDFQIDPFYRGPNLDIGATIYDVFGVEVDTSSPEDDLGASFSSDLAPGEYYLAIEGTGRIGEGSDFGYTDYGSLGYYSIEITQPTSVKGIDLLTNGLELLEPTQSLGGAVVASLEFTTLNRGDRASGDFGMSFYLSEDEIIDPATDVLLTLHPFDPNYDETQPGVYAVDGGIAAGADLTDTVYVTVPNLDPFETDDSYYIGLVSDVSSEVVEVSEINNSSNGETIDLAHVRYRSVLESFNLDTEPVGWTTEGEWQFGVPTGQGGELFGNADPTSGATGSNVFGVDLDGDYDLFVGGPWYLTTAAMDFSGYFNVAMEFQRWLNLDFQDHIYGSIEVSNDGETWTTVFENPEVDAIIDEEWTTVEYDISAVADDQSEVYVRWGYQVNVDAFPYSGWNLDDINFLGSPVDSLTGQIQGTVWGDVNADGDRDPEDLGLEDWLVFLDENNNGVRDSETNQIGSFDLSIALPDESTTTTTLDVSSVPGAIDSLTVLLDISHLNVADLDVFLVSPSGTRVELFTDVGSSGNNFVGTMLDDAASTPINFASAPFTGTFSPEGSLSDFVGEDPTGLWTLEITDDNAGTSGTLDGWALTFDTSEYSMLTDGDGNYSFTGLFPDFYQVIAESRPDWTRIVPSDTSFLNAPAIAGETIAGNDFAFDAESGISGYLWHDEDGNGLKNGQESFLEGQIVFVDVDGNGEFSIAYSDFESSEVPVEILDLATVTSTILVEDDDLTILDVNATLDISHTYDGDLSVFLISPSGTRVELFSNIGATGSGFLNTTLDDEASQLISDAGSPYTGTFRPLGSLADFLETDSDPKGTWTLEVTDVAGGDTGTLHNWSLSLGTGSEPFAVTDSNGEYSIDGILPGQYQVRQILQDNWFQTHPLSPAEPVQTEPNSTQEGVNFGSRQAPAADFDGDFRVTGFDFLILQRGYGTGSTRAEGDTNEDSLVNGLDLDTWESEYPQNIPAEGVVALAPTADFDQDNLITGLDFLSIQREVNSGQVSGELLHDWESEYLANAGSESIEVEEAGQAVFEPAYVQSSNSVQEVSVVAEYESSAIESSTPAKVFDTPSSVVFQTNSSGAVAQETPQTSQPGSNFGRELLAFAPLSSLMTSPTVRGLLDTFDSETNPAGVFSIETLSSSVEANFGTPLDEVFADGDSGFRFGSGEDEGDWLVAVSADQAEAEFDELWRDWI